MERERNVLSRPIPPAVGIVAAATPACYASSSASHGHGAFHTAFFLISFIFVVALVVAGNRYHYRVLTAFLVTVIYVAAVLIGFQIELAVCGGRANDGEFSTFLLAAGSFFVLAPIGLIASMVLLFAGPRRHL